MEQQQQQGKGGGQGGWTPVAMALPEKAVKVFPQDNNFIAYSEAEVFYGIALPEGEGEADTQKVFTDKTECLAALKRYRLPRFKAFRTYEEALRFAEAGAAVAASQGGAGEEGAATPIPVNVEKPSPFRGPKSQDLVKFRKSIERADFHYFSQCMDENPRYLVSSGDTPAVLQEGFRYNALHVACRTNRPAYVEKVLVTVSRPEFFQRLYPEDSLESATRRSAFLLDLYLNTPDKGFNDTPLHFASKHGSVECVRILASYPGCDTTRPNKYAQTAAEIAGSRMKEKSAAVVGDIRRLMGEQYYVPLLRDDDLCLLPRVGSPWSPQLDSPTSPPGAWFLTSSPLSVTSASPISPSLKVRALAGPMSCPQAEAFHRLWRSTSTASTASTPSPARLPRGLRPASLRITDHEKGLECAGRSLAAEQRVGWKEHWGFLDTFTNLSNEGGLEALETHLRNRAQQLRRERDELDASALAERLREAQMILEEEEEEEDSSLSSPGTQRRHESLRDLSHLSWLSQASGSPLAQLCRGLEALRLNASLSPQGDAPPTACSKFLLSLQQQQQQQHASPEFVSPQGPGGLTEQVSYVLKSVEVSAGRVSDALLEAALDLQVNIATSLGMNRTLRAKVRSEVACLRRVVARAGAELGPEGLDLGFVHPLLAGRAVMALWQSAMPEDVTATTQAVRLIVSHMDLVALDSSDEEISGSSRHCEAPQRSTCGDAQHLGCVLRCLDVALQTAAATSDGITSPEVPQLGQCQCPWQRKADPRAGQDTVPASTLERGRATAYLQRVLQGNKRDAVVRHLSFTTVEGEEEGGQQARATAGDKKGVTVVQESVTFAVNSKDGQEEQGAGCRSPDSFVSAASSLEGDMCTPEEGVAIFIGGDEATKTDVDVLAAVGERLVDEHKYPHVFQWQLLVKSFSEVQRGSWESPFCRRGRARTGGGGGGGSFATAPSKLSLPNTPQRPPASRPPASTPRVLFRRL